VTDHVAAGAVFVPFNQRGFAANGLLSGSMVASVTIAPATEPSEDAGPETVGSRAGGPP
jgi:acyl dehydratase